MNKNLAMISGAGLGAGLMFLMDPQAGRRRRSLVRDKLTRMVRQTEDFIESKGRHFRNVAKGRLHEMKSQFSEAQSQIQDQLQSGMEATPSA
jgi:gas vesicle protein